MSRYRNSPYLPAMEKVREFTRQLSEIGLPPEKIAEAVAEALTSANPKVRYQITPDPMRHLITACCRSAPSTGSSPSGLA